LTYINRLPFSANANAITGQAAPTGNAAELFALMVADPGQGRARCIWSPVLAACALGRCERMASEGWAGHVDPQGFGPNHALEQAGWQLPSYYGRKPDGSEDDAANNVESLAQGGTGAVAQIWDNFMHSPIHRRHILAETDFFKAQTLVGTAFVQDENSVSIFYWSVMSAPPQGTP
jgi:uncharacterized protein YkwD